MVKGYVNADETLCARAKIINKNYLGLKEIISILKECNATDKEIEPYREKFKKAKEAFKKLHQEIQDIVLEKFTAYKDLRLDFSKKEIAVYE